MPPLLAVASVVFLFDETFQIYGGNIASTMAGEYSFSIALSLAMLFFGVFAYALRTGKHRALAAVLFALACLSHGIVIFFVVIGALVLFGLHLLQSIHGPIRAGAIVKVALTTTVVGGLLSAFWVIPFVLLHRFGTDMFYERNSNYADMLFPQPAGFDWLLTGVAAIGLLGAVLRRSLSGLFLGIMTVLFAAWAVVMPQSLLWNNRLLPFMYLTRYMLAAVGVVEIGRAIARLISPESRWLDWSLRLATLGVASLGVWLALGLHFRVLPFGGFINEGGRQVYAWPQAAPILKSETAGYVKYWAKWNYEGYEAKDAYGEYNGIVNTMKGLGEGRGCGRAVWENNNDQNKYGTPMALMLLPFWTDGCIGSMEGLFFEASGTTPYHFLTTSALSKNSSDPVRRLRYEKGEVDKGVEYLKTLGVRYYLAYNPEVVSLADVNPDLEKVATSGPWHVYEVKGTELVTPLAMQPVVVEGVNGSDRDSWLEVGTSWFQDQEAWTARARGRRSRQLAAHHRRACRRPPERRPVPGPGRPVDAHRARPPARGHGHRRGDRRRQHLVPGRPRRRADPGAHELLPELEGRGCRGALPVRSQPHGGGADLERGDAHLRVHRHRDGLVRAVRGRAGRAGLPLALGSRRHAQAPGSPPAARRAPRRPRRRRHRRRHDAGWPVGWPPGSRLPTSGRRPARLTPRSCSTGTRSSTR